MKDAIERLLGLRPTTAIVNFHQPDARAVVQSRKQRRVKARRQRRRYTRLQWVCRREARSNQFRGLSGVVLPVVIGDEQRSIAVAKLQCWIGQHIWHTRGRKAGTNATRYDSVRATVVAQHEARDDNVLNALDLDGLGLLLRPLNAAQ